MDDQNLFQEIVQSPEFLRVQGHVASLLGEGVWWYTDLEGNRYPLDSEKNTVCPTGRENPEQAISCKEDTRRQLESVDEAGVSLFEKCCQGHLRSQIPFFYRMRLIGTIGVCFLKDENRQRAESALSLLEAYVRIYCALLSEYDDLEYVHSIWQEMVGMSNLEELLPRILNETLKALNLKQGVLYLTDDDGRLTPQARLPAGHKSALEFTAIEGRGYQDSFRKNPSFAVPLEPDDPLSKWTRRCLSCADSPDSGKDCKEWNYYAVPFWTKEHLLGVIVTRSRNKRLHLSPEERMLRMITEGAAAVLEGAINVNRIRQRSLALSTIHTMHRLMSSAASSKDLIDKVARLAAQIIGTSKCSVMMLEEKDGRSLRPTAEFGMSAGEIGSYSLHEGEGIPGWVLENYEPLIVHRPMGDKRFEKAGEEVYPEDSYLSVPMIGEDILGVITVSGRAKPFAPSDRDILLTLSEQSVIALGNTRLMERQQQLVLSSLRSIANVIETKDPYSKGHTERVEEVALLIGASVMDDPRWLANLRYSALLHDAGEVSPRKSASIVHAFGGKAGTAPVEPEPGESEHAYVSVQIARSMRLDRQAIDMIRFHHESYDGTGYPQGLKGEQIPLGSRILALADSYVTLEQRGQAGKHYTPEQVLLILKKKAGRKFDPKLVSVLQGLLKDGKVRMETEESIFG
jgi:HD-GYP domain-containing protein (c-di-GMP phosphodiesterase class II)